jgi:hypothetical protein
MPLFVAITDHMEIDFPGEFGSYDGGSEDPGIRAKNSRPTRPRPHQHHGERHDKPLIDLGFPLHLERCSYSICAKR